MRTLAFRPPLAAALVSAVFLAAPAGAADHAAHPPAATSDAAVAGTTLAQATGAPAATSPAPTPDNAATATRMQSLRDHMQQMRRTRDPATRMRMMEEHMTQMEAMMKDMETGCPMAGKGGMRMGGGMGMGMMGPGMGGGGTQGDAMTTQRLEALEKRLDMMQMLLQQQQAPAAGRRP